MPPKNLITFTSLIDKIFCNPTDLKSITIKWLTHCAASLSDSTKEKTFALKKDPDFVSAKLVLLFQALKTNTHVTKLEIVGCRIGENPDESVAEALGDLISRNIHLREVILSHNYFSFNFIQWINSGLTSTESRLVKLDLSNNKLGIESITHLLEALHYSSLKHLDLSYNFIGLPEAIRLAPNPTTNTISYISELGKMLAMLLNSSLESLRLEGCNIADDPILKACQLLQGSKIVPMLDIKWNHLTEIGIEALFAIAHGTIDARNNKSQHQLDYVAPLGRSEDHYES